MGGPPLRGGAGARAGSYALATLLAGHVYEREGRAHGDPAGTCRGSDCFRWTFLLLTTLSFLALGVAVMLWRRTQHLYAKVIEHTRTERQRRGLAVAARPCVSASLSLFKD